MTRVCMVVHQDYFIDERVRRYAEALAAADVEVDVVCLRSNRLFAASTPDNIRVYTIPLRRGYLNRFNYLFEYGLALILFTFWLTVLAFKRRYQVIHVHNMPDFLIFAALLPKLRGAKLILDIHDPMPEFYRSKFKSKTSWLVRLMEAQEKASIKVADAVITANKNFKRNLIERGVPLEKMVVVTNVADPAIFNRADYAARRQNPRPNFTLIYPGTIAPRYGLDVAIRALPYLLPQVPQLQLVIIGQQVEYVDELCTLARELGVSAALQIKPAIPVDQVPAEISQADIGIYPARPDPHMSIATPTKVLEFAVMGLPIVASRLPVLEDLFTDEAILFFEPGNPEQFAAQILTLYHQPQRRRELVNHADRIFVQTHSWHSERAVYFQLLGELLHDQTRLFPTLKADVQKQL